MIHSPPQRVKARPLPPCYREGAVRRSPLTRQPGQSCALRAVKVAVNRPLLWHRFPSALLGTIVATALSLAAAPSFAMWSYSEFPIPTANSAPSGITAGPDGALWFTEFTGNKIGRITTAGVVTEFPIPTANSGPMAITAGPDGALWFTELTASKIGRITTAGVITEFPVPSVNDSIQGIAAGSDGALWFGHGAGAKIGRITTDGVVTEFPALAAKSITSAPDGALWFTSDLGTIGRITTDGSVSSFHFASPGTDSSPANIAVGLDGALWFTESAVIGPIGVFVNRINRMTLDGTLTISGSWGLTSGWLPITAGPHGSVWFAASGSNRRHTDGSVAIWLMNGTSFVSATVVGSVPNGQIARVGDFNGDEKADILIRYTNGDVEIWYMNGTSVIDVRVLGNVDPSWVIQ